LSGLLICSVFAIGQAIPPRIFYSDLEAGPNQGGENNAGVYVSIYGKNFGGSRGSSTVTIGGSAAATYPIWTDTKITFQLGSAAQTGNIVVITSNGASNGVPFNVRAGSIYFVSTAGNDGNNGSFSSPWRTLLKVRDMPEGSIAYAMTGISQTADDGTGFAAAFTLGKQDCGTVPRALIAYPGATVNIGTTSGPAIAIRASSPSSRGGLCAGAWVFAGLTLRGSVAATDLQGLIGIPTNNFRFVANDMSCPNGDGATACVGTAWLNGAKFFGNNIHDTGKATASALYHGVYFGTNSNHLDFGWNIVANVHGCRGIQVHSSDGDNQFDIKIHDNIIHDTQCDGIILASVDPSKGPVEIFNNLIYNAGKGPNNPEGTGGWTCIQAPGYGFNNKPATGTVEIYHNTMYNCGIFSFPPYPGSIGGILVGNVSPNMFVRLRNNIIHTAPGRPYLITYNAGGPICGDSQACPGVSGNSNLFFGILPAPGNPFILNSLNANPLFLNAASADFHLRSETPAKGAGVSTGLQYDFDGVARVPTIDIGALQAGGAGGGTPGTADLTISKTHSGNFAQGQNGAVYSIVVTNAGAGPTSGTVTVTDTLPAGLTLVSMSGSGWSCAAVTCTRTSVLASGASYLPITVIVNVASNASASVTNAATVSGGGDSNAGNNTANDTTIINPAGGPTSGADVTISKTHAGSFTAGQAGATYTITVTNVGTAATSGLITVLDTLPSGLIATSMGGPGWSCVFDTLSCFRSNVLTPGASAPAITLTVNVASNAPGSVANVARVSGGGDRNTGKNTANDVTSISGGAGGSPDLAISKAHTGNFSQGQNGAAYSITVTNVGAASTAGTVTVTENLPSGLALVSMSGSGWNCVANICTTTTALGAGGSYPNITVTVNVTASAPASVTNSVSVSGGSDSNGSNNSASDFTTISGSGGGGGGGADITVTKTHTGNFQRGQNGTFTITVRNVGTAASSGLVTLMDRLPSGLTATAMSGSGWLCVLDSLICLRSNSLAAGAGYPPLILTVAVSSTAPASMTNVVTVSGGRDTNASNNAGSDTVTIGP